MKFKISIITVFLPLWISVTAFGQITFQKTYGVANNEYAHSVIQTNDGGYIFCGYTYSFGAGFTDVYLVKTDQFGDVMWTKTYGGVSADFGFSIKQTTDGGYIVTGNTSSFGQGAADVYLLKLDNAGSLQWSKTYGGPLDDKGWSVQQTADGGYVVLGQTNSFGSGANDMYLLKTDAAGNATWIKTFGGTTSDEGLSVVQTPDFGYVLCGRTESYGEGNKDVYLIKTDAGGFVSWTKTYGGTGDDEGLSLKQTTDGGFIISGHTNSFGAGQADVYLIKTNSTGDTAWTKTYGGVLTDYGNFIDQNQDGGYIITGHTFSYGFGNVDVYLIRTDAVGDTIWTHVYGGPGGDQGYSVIQTAYKEFMVAGHTNNFGNGQADYYLIKCDTSGISGCNEMGTGTIISGTGTVIGSGVINNSGGVEANAATIEQSHSLVAIIECYFCEFDFATMSLTVDSATCNGWNDGQAMANMVGGAGPFQYMWTPGNQTDATATGLAAGNYSVLITDTNGCDTTLTFTIYEPPPMVTTLTGDSIICGGDTATLIATGGTNYIWSTGDTGDTLQVTPIVNTSYYVTIYDGPCFVIDTFDVSILAVIPNVQIQGDLEICIGTSTTLSDNGPGSPEWSTGATTNSITVSPITTTTYWLALSNVCGVDTDSVVVIVNPLPLAYAGEDTTIFIGDEVQLFGSGGTQYFWDPSTGLSCTNCQNPVANPRNTTVYTLTVIDENGCINTDEVIVIIDKETSLFVPSAFSPNNDGQNDQLFVRGKGIKTMQFNVYDRWGEKVFATDNQRKGWDGTYKGRSMNSAVFVYLLVVDFKDGSEKVQKGNITLIR